MGIEAKILQVKMAVK